MATAIPRPSANPTHGFEPEDIVELILAPGLRMTVFDVDANTVHCRWITGRIERVQHFPAERLRLVRRDPKSPIRERKPLEREPEPEPYTPPANQMDFGIFPREEDSSSDGSNVVNEREGQPR